MRTTSVLLTLIVLILAGCAHTASIWLSEQDLAHYREQAVAAIDSPAMWQRFQKPQNERHTLARAPIQYAVDFGRSEAISVIVPTVETVSFHSGYVAVVFSRRSGEIVQMYESCWP